MILKVLLWKDLVYIWKFWNTNHQTKGLDIWKQNKFESKEGLKVQKMTIEICWFCFLCKGQLIKRWEKEIIFVEREVSCKKELRRHWLELNVDSLSLALNRNEILKNSWLLFVVCCSVYVCCVSAASNMIMIYCSVEGVCLKKFACVPSQLRFFLFSVQKTKHLGIWSILTSTMFQDRINISLNMHTFFIWSYNSHGGVFKFYLFTNQVSQAKKHPYESMMKPSSSLSFGIPFYVWNQLSVNAFAVFIDSNVIHRFFSGCWQNLWT